MIAVTLTLTGLPSICTVVAENPPEDATTCDFPVLESSGFWSAIVMTRVFDLVSIVAFMFLFPSPLNPSEDNPSLPGPGSPACARERKG